MWCECQGNHCLSAFYANLGYLGYLGDKIFQTRRRLRKTRRKLRGNSARRPGIKYEGAFLMKIIEIRRTPGLENEPSVKWCQSIALKLALAVPVPGFVWLDLHPR